MLDELIEQECYDKKIKTEKLYFMDKILDAVVIGDTIYHSPDLCGPERNDIMIHEIVHHETCPYNLFEADKPTQKKFERIARDKTVDRLFSLDAITELWEYGARTPEDFAEALEISVRFVCEALQNYQTRYGLTKTYNGYTIKFLPFEIRKNA